MAVLYTSISVLNLMRAATGSQCREIKRAVNYGVFINLNCNSLFMLYYHQIQDSVSFQLVFFRTGFTYLYFYFKNGLIVGIDDLSLKHTTVINSTN